MNPQTKELDRDAVVMDLPDIPPEGQVLCRMAVGHLPHQTAKTLLGRVASRSAWGAEKFGYAWRSRKNTLELLEETTDALVYAAQEAANIELGLTPVPRGSNRASKAQEALSTSARYAALADHYAQEAHQLIWDAPGEVMDE